MFLMYLCSMKLINIAFIPSTIIFNVNAAFFHQIIIIIILKGNWSHFIAYEKDCSAIT